MRTQRIVAAFALTAICGLISCTDGPSPVSPGHSGIARLALAPSYSVSGHFQILPINRIRLTAFVAGSTTPLPPTPVVSDVNPEEESWSLPVEFELPAEQQVQVEVLIELINRSPSGVETVEFSGLTAPLAVTSGNNQNVATVTVHPGPPENLDVNSVVITTSPADAVEGDVVALDASVDGPEGAEVTWGTLDPQLVQVSQDGDRAANITTLLPGTARIIAVAGPRADTVSIDILQRPSSVVIAPGDIELEALKAEATFTAQVLDPRDDPIPGAEIAWEIGNDDVATHLGGGRFRAEASGATQVTARAAATPSLSATADLTVAQRAAEINLSKSDIAFRALGAEATIEAEAEDANGNAIDGGSFDWSSSNEDVVTVDDEGNVEAVGVGSASITAALDGVAAQTDVTVEQVPFTVNVSPAEVVLTTLGETAQLDAAVADSLGNAIDDAEVEWSSSAAELVEVSESGALTAHGNGAATITAEAGDASGSAEVRVEQAAASIVVSPEAATFTTIGETLQLTASALDAGGSEIDEPTLTWTSSNDAVVTVSAEGIVTATGNGSASVTASSGGAEGVATLTVQQTAAALAISYELGAGDTPDALTAEALGGTHQFTANVTDLHGNAVAGAEIVWSSTNDAAATVDATGLVVITGSGSAYILAVSGAVRDSVLVTVQQAAAMIEVEPASVTFEAVGETQQLTAVVRDANANIMTTAPVDWSSSAPAIVSVTSSGELAALAQGSAVITATSGAASTTVAATVEQVIDAVEISISAATLTFLGASLQLSAVVLDQNGAEMAAAVAWSVIENGIVSVDPQDGEVVALGVGTARVVATAGAAEDTALITVVQTATTLEILPGDEDEGWTDANHVDLLALGDTGTVMAVVRDEASNVVPGAVVTWSSSNTGVLHISASGFITIVGNGESIVRAISGAARDSVFVSVHQEPAEIVVNPPNLEFTQPGDTARIVAEARDANDHLIPGYEPAWHSTDPEVAGVDDGLVTAVGNGTAWIKALGDNGTGDSTFVLVNLGAASVTLSEDTVHFGALFDDHILEAVARDGNGIVIESPLTWSSSDTTVAVVDGFGRVLPLRNGRAVIRVVAGEARDSAVALVQQVPHSIVAPEALIFTALGEQQAIELQVFDTGENAIEEAAVVWASTDTLVATVTQQGVVRAVGGGLAGISVSSGEASTSITALVLQPDSFTFNSLDQVMDLPTEVPGVNGPVAAITWTSANPSIINIDSETMRARSEGIGSTQVTGEFVYNDQSFSQTWHITVLQLPAFLNIHQDTLELFALGETLEVGIEARDSAGSILESLDLVQWVSSDPGVATVDTQIVTAVAQGHTKIYSLFNDVIDSAVVRVRQTGDSVSVSFPSVPEFTGAYDTVTIAVGDSLFAEVEAFDYLRNPIPDPEVQWFTNALDTSVVKAHQDGWIEARGPGSIMVTVQVDGATLTFWATVLQTAASIDILQDSATYTHIGEQAMYFTTVRDAQNNVISDSVSWLSLDTAVVVVDQGGNATARGNGATYIFAFAGPARDSTLVRVRQVTSHIELDQTVVALSAIGQQQTINVLQFLDAGNHPVTGDSVRWFTEDTLVARVVGSGPAAGVITATGNGSTRVRAAAGYSNDNWIDVTVQQQAASIDGIPRWHMFTNLVDSLQLAPVVRDANGSPVPGAAVTYTSQFPEIATVSGAGEVEPVASGVSHITAHSGDLDQTLVAIVFPSGTPETAMLFGSLGQTIELQPTIMVGDLTVGSFTWTSRNPEIVSVSENSAVAVSNGETVIDFIAQFEDGSEFEGSFQAVVEQLASVVDIVEDGISLAAIDATHQLNVSVTDASGNPLEVQPEITWTSQFDSVATVAGGLVAAVGNGTTWVYASAGDGLDSAQVAVSQVAASIEVSPDAHAFGAVGEVLSASAVVRDANGHPMANPGVIWTSSDSDVATVSSDGTVVAAGAGSATVAGAVLLASEDILRDTLVVTVPQAAASVIITNQDDSNSFASLTETKQLRATVLDVNENELELPVIWSSSNTTVATVDANGLVTALTNGDVVITATVADETSTTNVSDDGPPGPSGSASAVPPPGGDIALTVYQIPADVGIEQDSIQLNALFRSHDFQVNSVRDALGQPVQRPFFVNWTSENGAKVSVGTPDGAESRVGRALALGNGKTRVIADVEGVQDTALVHVRQIPGHLRITTRGVNINALTHSRHFQAEVLDPDSFPMETPPELQWSSLNTGRASVDAAGDVTAHGNGAAVIKAIVSQDGVVLEDTATVNIQQVPARLRLRPEHKNTNRFNAFGRAKQLVAAMQDSAGVDLELQPELVWVSDDETTFEVDANGNVSNKPKNGSGKIRVVSGEFEDTADFVTQQVPKQVRIKATSRGPRFRTLGRRMRMEAEVTDSAGFPFETPPALQWVSSNTGDAEFEGDELIARGNGKPVVTARYQGDGLILEDTTLVDIEQYGAGVKVKPESRGLSMRALNAQRRLEAEVQDSAGFALEQAAQDTLELGWSSATDTVQVDNFGNVTAKKNGRSKLTVAFNGSTDTVTVAVRQVGKKVEFPTALNPGQLNKRYRLEPIVKDSLGNPLEFDIAQTWSEDGEAIEVDGDSVIVSRANGQGRLIVIADEANDTLDIPVRQVITRLRMNRDTATLTAFDDELQLTPIAEDSSGTPVGDAAFSWASSDGTAVSVDNTGRIRANRNQQGVLATATLDDSEIPTDLQSLTTSATVTVSQLPWSFVEDTSAVVDRQHGKPGQQLTDPLKVLALDRNGNALEQGTVTWAPQDGSVDVASETLNPEKQGKSSTRWSMRQQAGETSLTATVTVADSAISYQFTAVVDGAEPSAVTFDDVENDVITLLLSDPVIISGIAHDNRAVDKIECVLTNTGSATTYGGTLTYTFPKNNQLENQPFSCDYSTPGLGIPTEVPLTLTVTVYDRAKNQSAVAVGVFIAGPPS